MLGLFLIGISPAQCCIATGIFRTVSFLRFRSFGFPPFTLGNSFICMGSMSFPLLALHYSFASRSLLFCCFLSGFSSHFFLIIFVLVRYVPYFSFPSSGLSFPFSPLCSCSLSLSLLLLLRSSHFFFSFLSSLLISSP